MGKNRKRKEECIVPLVPAAALIQPAGIYASPPARRRAITSAAVRIAHTQHFAGYGGCVGRSCDQLLLDGATPTILHRQVKTRNKNDLINLNTFSYCYSQAFPMFRGMAQGK